MGSALLSPSLPYTRSLKGKILRCVYKTKLVFARSITGNDDAGDAVRGEGSYFTRNYRVTVTNLPGGIVVDSGALAGQIMSPPVVAIHNRHLAPLWNVAVDADNTPLVDLWKGGFGVMDVQEGSGPIMPRQSATINVQVSWVLAVFRLWGCWSPQTTVSTP